MDIASALLMLRDVIGPGVDVTAAELLKDKEDYRVWNIHTQNPDLHLIVKLSGPQAKYTSTFERTAALHRLVRESTSIVMPAVIAADESCQKWPWRFFIKTFVPGSEWADVEKKEPAISLNPARAQLGSAVAELHQIAFSGFGELAAMVSMPGGGAGVAISEPLPFMDALEKRVRKMIPSPEGQDFILAAFAARADLFDNVPTASLCHEDLHRHNIILRSEDGWRLATILDFEKSWAGDREIDLARMDLWQMTGEYFWGAYRERFPVDAGYTERRPLYQLLWCVEYAQYSDDDEHLELTRRLCRLLGLPVLESFETLRFSG